MVLEDRSSGLLFRQNKMMNILIDIGFIPQPDKRVKDDCEQRK
jgi:hypothetical protein